MMRRTCDPMGTVASESVTLALQMESGLNLRHAMQSSLGQG